MGNDDILKPLGESAEVRPTIGVEKVREWAGILEKYKKGKRHLEQRIVDAEQAWKLRHWEQIRKKDVGDPEPTSGWLVNVILAKHSDACDNIPSVICMPREETDDYEAKQLTDILPVVFEQNEFPRVWSDIWWYKLKSGTGVYGVYWNPEQHGGLGDISIQKTEMLNLFWQPGIADIQDSRYVFQCRLVDNELLEQEYTQLKDKLKTGNHHLTRYVYDDTIDTSQKSMVVDVYYKKKVDGKSILHFAKFVDEELLFATENEREPQTDEMGNIIKPSMAETGLYAHGKYPFVFDALFPEEGYPNCGFGYVDLCKDPQKMIDVMDNAMIKNMLAGATPRWFVRTDGGINEDEYADLNNPFVHMSGRLDADSIMPIQHSSLDGVYVNLKQLKIDELKQISGNRDVNNGGATGSVTAASAIAALQEAGNGISRDMISASYRAFKQVVELCIELIREFYDVPRKFRITGDNGQQQFISYDNSGIKEQEQGNEFGIDMGYRLPVFDIDVQVQKESQYKTAAYNELAVQLFQLGAFNPQMADQVLPMLRMMDFKGKDELIRKVEENAKLQNYKLLAFRLAEEYSPMLFQQMLAEEESGGMSAGGGINPAKMANVSGAGTGNAYLDKARASAEGGSAPR